MHKHASALFLVLTANTGWVLAADPVVGTSSGTWVDPTPPSATVSGVGTPTFSWGRTTANSIDDLLTFTPVAGFSGTAGTPFKVGSVFYQNGAIFAGSQANSVSLQLDLNFSTPSFGPVTGKYVFDLVSTPNNSNPDQSADIINLPALSSSTSFVIGATQYQVKLSGFQNVVGDGFLTSSNSQFHVREQLSATADLYAVVTAQPVPEPATYGMMLAGLGVLGLLARRRVTNTKSF